MGAPKFQIPEPVSKAYATARLNALYRGHQPTQLYPRRGVTRPIWISWCKKCHADLRFLDLPEPQAPELSGRMLEIHCH